MFRDWISFLQHTFYRTKAARASMAKPPMEPMAAAPLVALVSVAAGVLVALDAAVGVDATVSVVSVVSVASVVSGAVVSAAAVDSAASEVVSAASVVVAAAAAVVSAAAAVEAAAEEPAELTAAQRAWTAGRTLLMATSEPQASTTQLVAAPWMVSKFLQTQV